MVLTHREYSSPCLICGADSTGLFPSFSSRSFLGIKEVVSKKREGKRKRIKG
jgi:hypothetical protein